MARSSKVNPTGHGQNGAISLDDLICQWEADGFGPMLAEARRRRQEQERAGEEEFLQRVREMHRQAPEGVK